MIKGIAASSGIAIAKAMKKEVVKMEIEERAIENIDAEKARFSAAIEQSKMEIEALVKSTKENIGESEAQVFEAHLMILEDPEVASRVDSKLAEEKLCVEHIYKVVTDEFIDMFMQIPDEYLRERAHDLQDVRDRVLRNLLGIKLKDFSNLGEETIIIARDLTPSDTASLDKKYAIGFVTEIGGSTSHSAIMARTLEIPAVVGTIDVLSHVNDGDMVIIDGDEGIVILSPSGEEVEKYQKLRAERNEFKKALEKMIGKSSETLDGHSVELAANIGSPNDLDGVLKYDSEGVGLYRTEFLYMDNTAWPTEDEQFEAYKKVAQGLDGKPVVIRTLDIGGDKELSYYDLPEEMNPFLGYRAIRLCLDQKDIFKTQLRAIFRASAFGNIRIMFPMISSVEELRAAKAVVNEVKAELKAESIEYDDSTQIGMMIEIPAAAVISDLLAKEVDFFSLGTNDLIQYTAAVDRMNSKIAHLYNPFHPAIIRLINTVIQNGHKEGIWVGMCGETAGNPLLVPLFLAMGLDEFSMSPSSILRARHIIRNSSKQELEKHLDEILSLSTAEEIKKAVEEKFVL
ncbi:MAG: phosphoenolpyruvate--protein phosphotransferase [Tissierellales bacterium]|jgi:phosphotransferase system enzyme I (PtsI)|nr:phosphoenolpyruvate--protein phosphotransferase [Tissierellales bacterium]